MWTTWLPSPPYLKDPGISNKLRKAYTTLVFLDIFMWAIGLITHDLLRINVPEGQKGMWLHNPCHKRVPHGYITLAGLGVPEMGAQLQMAS